MPTGQTPTPEFEGLAYGENDAANRLSSMFPVAEEADEDEFVPQGDEDNFIFGPSDRPAEPLTAGAPFGPGADIAAQALESDDAFADRVADTVVTAGASSELKAWAARRKAGL